MDKISVIIVNWNVAASLTKCLASLHYPHLEIIVIDNASQVSPVLPSSVHLILNDHNVGFPKALNQGLRQATGNYLLVLNPDTRLPKDFFTKALAFFAAHPDAGVMGPKFIDPDGSPQGSVFSEPSIFSPTIKYTPPDSSPVSVNCVSGACMFFPRATLQRVGYFTEQVFMYFEDFDYCRRIRQAGLKIYFNPEITIVHEHGQSSAQTPSAPNYLAQSSLWYNGPIKYYLQTLVLKTRSKLHL